MNRTLRLLCALLTILVAIPAMQARACTPLPAVSHETAHHAGHEMTSGHHAGHHRTADEPSQQAPAPTSVHHDCIGCIAPIDRDFYRPVATPFVVTSRHDGPADAPFHLYHAGAPEPPPPRIPA